MSLPKIIENPVSWKILEFLDKNNSSISFEQIKCEIDEKLEDTQIIEVVSFMKNLNYPIQLTRVEGNPWVEMTNEAPVIFASFSFSQWLSFQAHFPKLGEMDKEPFHETLQDCLEKAESENKQYDLFEYSKREANKNHYAVQLEDEKKNIILEVEEAVKNQQLLLLGVDGNKRYEVYPHKVVFLDGILCVVGEEVIDRCLVSFDIQDVISCEKRPEHTYLPNFSNVEIDDFIFAMRAVSGNEERLILKVRSPEKVNLKPEYHFLGNPYVTTNLDGDLIWAASVEISDELFQWLGDYQNDVEILDPQEVRVMFEEYLEKGYEDGRFSLKKAS